MQTLIDYYRSTVDLNDSKEGGWSVFYYGVLSKIINDNNFKKIAEVGIGYGTHAKHVLRNTNIDTLYLIDPMCYYANDGFVDDIMKCKPQKEGNNFNEMYDLINNELSPWKERYTWFRVPSVNITDEQVANESLDCVFVDGDHSYDAVVKDLPFWWKKIRPGGKMLGDDYWMNDVEKAVTEFSQIINISAELLTLKGNSYKIFCFSKPL
jgi:hypothetical protein